MKTHYQKTFIKANPFLACFIFISLLSCKISFGQELTLTPSVYGGSNISCHGCHDGYIIANVTGATAPYTYFWFDNGSLSSAMLPSLVEILFEWDTYSEFPVPGTDEYTDWGAPFPIYTGDTLSNLGIGHYYLYVLDASLGDFYLYSDINSQQNLMYGTPAAISEPMILLRLLVIIDEYGCDIQIEQFRSLMPESLLL